MNDPKLIMLLAGPVDSCNLRILHRVEIKMSPDSLESIHNS